MNPRYEPQRDWQFRRLVQDLQLLEFRVRYPDLAVELAKTFAMLQLKRGCRR